MKKIRTFVPHVKTGYEDRAVHMEKMLDRMGIGFSYMLDGDIPDLTPEIFDRYFSEAMSKVCAGTSCAVKHLSIYERMIAEQIPEALVLEDDMFLSRKFIKVLEKAREEVAPLNRDGKPVWIGFEATFWRFVPRSRREKGRVVYPGDIVQCTGAYYVNLPMARHIITSAVRDKISVPIDVYADLIRSRDLPESFFWTYPVTAEQGSHNGRMASSISWGKKRKTGWFRSLNRDILMAYKRMIAWLK